MIKDLLRKNREKIVYVLIGGTNTLIDFGLLFLLVNFIYLEKTLANIISTSIAMIFSYLMNKKFTFQNKSRSRIQFIKFIAVTAFGLWVLQSLIINLLNPVVMNFTTNTNFALLITKIIATAVTLVWNFILYKKVVFNDSKTDRES